MRNLLKLMETNEVARQAIMNTVTANPELEMIMRGLYEKYATNAAGGSGSDSGSAEEKKQKRNPHARSAGEWGFVEKTVGWMKRSDVLGEVEGWF